jgi:hypothetical protein
MDDNLELRVLNSNSDLDFILSNHNVFHNDDFINPYNDASINSQFYDKLTFQNKFKNSPLPIIFNLNIQSIASKHTSLKEFITSLLSNNVNIKVICLQEVWQVPFPELINIPGFSFISKQRETMRGGGVGFYVKNDIKYKLLQNHSPFIDKIFESLTIEITLNGKKCLLCNYYRSPSPIHNMTASTQLTEFIDAIDNLSSSLTMLNYPCYLVSDTNINLLNFVRSENSENYLHSLHSNGFLLTNYKATRMQNNSTSLIDHIFSNNIQTHTETGTVICDISDHFISFIQIPFPTNRKPNTAKPTRKFSTENINRFKESLRNQCWRDVLASEDVNVGCGTFWETFSTLYDIHFPIIITKFNRNIHKLNEFMTAGLLISR